MRDKLTDAVLEQITIDIVQHKDYTAIEELLLLLPDETLLWFLPEETAKQFKEV